MAARPRRTERAKPLRLACWNADGVRGRKLELEHFLSQHGVDICLLMRQSSTMVKPSGLPIMSATAQTDRQQGAVQPSWSAVV
jgi:hypothetical protein